VMLADSDRGVRPHPRPARWIDGDGDGRADVADLRARTVLEPPRVTPYGILVSGRAEVLPLVAAQPLALDGSARSRCGWARRLGPGRAGRRRLRRAQRGLHDRPAAAARRPAPDRGARDHRLRQRRGTRRAATLATAFGNADGPPVAALTVIPARARRAACCASTPAPRATPRASPLRARFDFDGDGGFDTSFGPLVATATLPPGITAPGSRSPTWPETPRAARSRSRPPTTTCRRRSSSPSAPTFCTA